MLSKDTPNLYHQYYLALFNPLSLLRKVFIAIKLLRLAHYIVQTKKQQTEENEWASNYQSQTAHPSIKALYKLILQQEYTPWEGTDNQAILAAIEVLDVPALEALREDLPFWTTAQKFTLDNSVQEETDIQKIALFTRIIYANQWLSTTKNPSIHDLYFPIFLFSLLQFKAIDYSYRASVLLKIQTFTSEELELLKTDALQWNSSQREELYRIIGADLLLNDVLRHLINHETNGAYTSMSSNPKIIQLYLLVIEEAKGDYIYEHAYLGADNLLSSFTAEDWEALFTDLPLWQNLHLETFTLGVLEHEFPNHQRLNTLLLLSQIGQKENRPRNDIGCIMIENEELSANLLHLLTHYPSSLAPIKELLALLQVQQASILFAEVRAAIQALETGL